MSSEYGVDNLAFEGENSKPSEDLEGTKPNNAISNVGGDGQEESEEDETRDVWDNQLEFLLSCISMSVGLGNVWRFPFTAFENGGGAFLIPYLIVLTFIGRPIYYLEMCVGQFSRYGPVKIWTMAPILKGIGYGSAVGTICIVTYYCSIMAVTVFYFIASFSETLPWSRCERDWGGDLCNPDGTINQTANPENKTISELYYQMEAFPQKFSIDDGLGKPEWRLTLCLAFSWLIIFLSLVKGVKSSGKVAYFTAIFPYVVLLILLVRGVTLDGAVDGIKYFVEPQWEKLKEVDVWYAAVGQCFFSLGTGFGPIITFSSYNPFKHNVYRDAIVISFMDTFTSFLSGCTIFAILGYLAKQSGSTVEAVTEGGPGLAFVSYPASIAQFTFIPQFFSVLFFLMLFTLGVGTATSLTGGVITIICDQFPRSIRWVVTMTVCILGFLAGLMYITPGGQFMVDLMDNFGANFVIYTIVTLEVVGVAWVYGLGNFCKDIEFMIGRKTGWFWKFCWGILNPVGLAGILIYSLTQQNEEFTSGGNSYPHIAIVCGWILAALAIATVPVFGIHGILSRKAETLKQKFLLSLKPTHDWGPQDPKLRKTWMEFTGRTEGN